MLPNVLVEISLFPYFIEVAAVVVKHFWLYYPNTINIGFLVFHLLFVIVLCNAKLRKYIELLK